MLDKIMQRIGKKGWNLYSMGNQDTPYEAIMRGPSEVLVLGKQYALLPRVPKSRDPHQVMNATRDLVENGMDAYVDFRGRQVPIGTIVFYDQHVLVNGFEEPDTVSSHKEFYRSLDTLLSLADTKFPTYLPER